MSPMWWIMSIISTIFELYIFDHFTDLFIGKKSITLISRVTVYFFTAIFLICINTLQSPLLDITAAISGYWFFLIIAYRTDYLTLLFDVILFFVPMASIEYLVRTTCFTFFEHISIPGYAGINMLGLFAVLLAEKMYLLISYRSCPWHYRKWFGAFLLVTAIDFFVFLILLNNGSILIYRSNARAVSLLVGYTLLMSYLLCFYFLEKLIQTAEEERKQQAFIQKIQLEQSYYDAIQKKNEEQAELLHDVKHHIRMISQMAFQKQNNDVVDYCGQYTKTLTVPRTIEYTNSKTVNVILSEKSAVCEQNNICFEIKANVCNLDFLDSITACSLFGNLLDNAIEAAGKCDDKKFITIQISEFNTQFILIVICNSYIPVRDSSNFPFFSMKADQEKHGYGMKSVQRMVVQHGGTMTVSHDNHIFKTSILLNRSVQV